jgi:molybdenum cofactor cytidylyltransferase
MSRIGAIILAAGNSSRLGRPKQLLAYRGRTLLTHVVAEAQAADLRPLTVVTGAFQAEVSESLRGEAVDIVFNPAWETGMASGIVAGMSNMLLLYPDVNAVVIAVCDQPYISASLLLKLVSTFETSGKGIVGCSYEDNVGTPVLFSAAYFERLLALSGNEGAKKLVRQHTDDLATVDFPEGNIDIDTPDDARKFRG